MSHHYSGPDFGFPHGDARLDFTDLYAFPKPGEADKSILIMNVHPSAVVNPPGPLLLSRFRLRRCTSSRLTRTAMQWRISLTVCSSRLREMVSRLQQCAGFKAHGLLVWAMRANSSLSRHQCQLEGKPR